ncbi:septum site-determining protein MinC [Piscinibacter sp.]|uniref:septum site-determining protein MinC n=1 Tax=Piscinibacter sp. TaxID=1903157 RepID=UPI002B925A25|nr:septum site-determining protein MinC [Albitalea sp.]HUG21360.1 septum site-determining protein MinC [Albitalea sp.]
MAVAPPSAHVPIFDLRSASLTLVALVLKTSDLAVLAKELERRFVEAPNPFEREPVVLDLGTLAESGDTVDFAALIALLQRHEIHAIGAKGGSPAQMAAAAAAGLIEAPETIPVARPEPKPAAAAKEPVQEIQAPAWRPALVVDKPLRSGQQVYAKGGDLVVLAAVNFGAEVLADGHIHVYAPLRGRAVAGARGNVDARIFSTCMEPQLVSIAGTYRTIDTALPADVAAKPAQVRLAGDKLVIEALKL